MKWLPNEIKALRLRLGWTQAELGRRLGFAQNVIESWESASSKIPETVFADLAALEGHLNNYSTTLANLSLAEQFLKDRAMAQTKGDLKDTRERAHKK